MPFCKRTVLPKDVCKPGGGGGRLREARPRDVFGDLADVCGFSLCSVLRQLSDLSRHSVSILEDLEGELVSVCRRSGALQGRLVRLQRTVTELLSNTPPRGEGVKHHTPGVTSHSWSCSWSCSSVWRSSALSKFLTKCMLCSVL